MSRFRRWLVMTSLCLSGGVLYLLPYLFEIYYLPLQEALGLSRTQLGSLMSAFGITALLCYFPGGWLADRISPRKLLTISCVSTGLAGFYFATFPSYAASLAIHAFWGVSVTLTFWAALIKATRNWASADQQGRAFGILEGGRGGAEAVFSSLFLAVFAVLGSGRVGLAWVIILLSITAVLLGAFTWLALEDSGPESSKRRDPVRLSEIITVLRMPAVWLMSVVIFTAYCAYWGSFSFTPYATEIFGASVVLGGAIGIAKSWVKPIPAVGAGFLADRIGASKAVAWSFGILIVSFGTFALVPGRPDWILLVIVNTVVASLAVFAIRGIYFALLEEGGVPLALTGTATGIVSVVGYTPDIFMPVLGGALLDRYPGAPGYRYLFLFVVGMCVLGLMAALYFRRLTLKHAR